MTLSITTVSTQYDGTGLETALATVFPFFVDTDIIVTSRVKTTGVDTVLTKGTHYTVTGGSATGATGTVTPIDGSVDFPSTVNWTIERSVPLTQSLDYVENDSFPAASHEAGLDRLTMQAQDRAAEVGRGLMLSVTDVDGSGAFDGRSNRIENIDDPIENQDAATKLWTEAKMAELLVTPSVTVTPAGEDLMNDATPAAQMITLGGGTAGINVFEGETQAASALGMGVTAYMHTVLLEATAAAARENLKIGGENLLINGGFEVWQHGLVFNTTVPAAGANNDGSYFADQWMIISDGNDVVDVGGIPATVPLSVPEGGSHAAFMTVQTFNKKFGVYQPIEYTVTLPLRSRVVTISYNAYTVGGGTNLTNMRCHLISYNAVGGGDDITGNPIDAWNGAGTPPSMLANYELVEPTVTDAEEADITGGSLAANRFSASFTVPANAVNIAVMIIADDANIQVGDILVVANIKLELGTGGGYYAPQRYEDVLRRCQRFYLSTFDYQIPPQEDVDNTIGCLTSYVSDLSIVSHIDVQWRFPVPMVDDPAILTYNPMDPGTGWNNATADANLTAAVVKDKFKAHISFHGTIARDEIHSIHATADARL